MKKWKWDDVTEGGLRGRRANLESVIWEGIYLGGRGDLSCDLKDKEPVLPRSASSASVSVVREDKAFQAVGTAVTESRGGNRYGVIKEDHRLDWMGQVMRGHWRGGQGLDHAGPWAWWGFWICSNCVGKLLEGCEQEMTWSDLYFKQINQWHRKKEGEGTIIEEKNLKDITKHNV